MISAWRPSSEEGWLANAQAIQRLILFAAEPATIFDVRPALGDKQGIHAPAAVNPEFDALIFQNFVEVNYVTRGHNGRRLRLRHRYAFLAFDDMPLLSASIASSILC